MKSKVERERERKKLKEMSVRVLCLPRNFSVSVMRFLNWGLSWSFINVRPKMLVPYVWLVVFVKELVRMTRFAE